MKLHYLIALLALLLAGCRHPVVIIGEGDVTSASGDRDCLLEDYQARQGNCVDNDVEGAYRESYYPTPRPGYVFNAWGNYCGKSDGIEECSFNLSAKQIADAAWDEAPPLVAYFRREVSSGHNAVLMGHSFFQPFYAPLQQYAPEAGFDDHQQATFFSGGGGGAPIAFWNDTESANHQGIKDALDQGNLTLFGMTTYPNDFDYALQGYRNWIDYALRENENFTVFIGMPWGTDPGSLTLKEYRGWWQAYHESEVHATVDILRQEYPQLEFYCIPYGQAAIELIKRYERGELPELDALIGDWDTSIFSDALGHGNRILVELASLVWLRAVYGVDLQTMDFPELSHWSIDMPALAEEILNRHDHAYDAP